MSTVALRSIERWPGVLRDPVARVPTPFTASWDDTTSLLRREVDHLAGADTEAVLEVAVRPGDIYRHGELKPTARWEHPGVVISFKTLGGRPLQFATDVHRDRHHGYLPGWQSNVRAVALALEALRRVDRYGVGQAEQQYVGWSALPPGTPMPAPAITADEAARLLAAYSRGSAAPEDLIDDPGLTRAVFRMAARVEHPDTGGDPDKYRTLVAARDVLAPSP